MKKILNLWLSVVVLFMLPFQASAQIGGGVLDATARSEALAAQASATSALSGSANDSTARTAASSAQSSATSALSGSANDSTARTAASNAQSSATSALSGSANDSTARTAASNAQAGVNSLSSALSVAAVSIGSGFCSGASVPQGNAAGFLIYVGTSCGANTGVLNFGEAAPHGWNCIFSNINNASYNTFQQSNSTTSVSVASLTTVAYNWISGSYVRGSCFKY